MNLRLLTLCATVSLFPQQTENTRLRAHRLENGLEVLLAPDPSLDAIFLNFAVRVGPRCERDGRRGIAHLLEHLMFEGSDASGDLREQVGIHGGSVGGTSGHDVAIYEMRLPAKESNLRFVIEQQAQWFASNDLLEEDLAREIGVVTTEIQLTRDQPEWELQESVLASAYKWHGYGNKTHGTLTDLAQLDIQDVRAFYKEYYRPDNALLLLTGAFDPDLALSLVEEHFGAIPAPSAPLKLLRTREPAQRGERFVVERRDSSVQVCGAGYHICAGSHPDAAALDVLAQMLVAAPSGRLHKSLVSSKLASRVGFRDYIRHRADPGFLYFEARIGEAGDPNAAHDALVATMESVAAVPFSDESELIRARTQLVNEARRTLESPRAAGKELSKWFGAGDWRLFFLWLERVESVTLEDVNRVASTYVVKSNRTSGVLLNEPASLVQVPPAPTTLDLLHGYEPSLLCAPGEGIEPTLESIQSRTTFTTVPCGIRLGLLSKRTRGDRVHVSFSFPYGDEEARLQHRAALDLMPLLMQRGTTELTNAQLLDQLAMLRSTITLTGTPGRLEARLTTYRENLAPSLRLLAEVVRTPRLSDEDFQLVKERKTGDLELTASEPHARAAWEVQRLLAAGSEPALRVDVEEHLERMREVEPDEVRACHKRLLGAAGAVGCAVGNFDEKELAATIETAFAGWVADVTWEPVRRGTTPGGAREAVHLPGKQLAIVAAGCSLPLDASSEDYVAIYFANYVLGLSPKNRLNQRLRQEEGLVYSPYSVLVPHALDGVSSLWMLADCSPSHAEAALAAMREEFDRWWKQGLTDDEIDLARESYEGEWRTSLADDSLVAFILLRELRESGSLSRALSIEQRLMTMTRPDLNASLRQVMDDADPFQLLVGDLGEEVESETSRD